MKARQNRRSETQSEFIGTLKFAGWIGLFLIIVLCIVFLLGK